MIDVYLWIYLSLIKCGIFLVSMKYFCCVLRELYFRMCWMSLGFVLEVFIIIGFLVRIIDSF